MPTGARSFPGCGAAADHPRAVGVRRDSCAQLATTQPLPRVPIAAPRSKLVTPSGTISVSALSYRKKSDLVIIYLLGPSGVGKSNAASLLRLEKSGLHVVDLDDEFRGREFNWNAIGPRLSRLHGSSSNESHIVVDVGAGTQTLPGLYAFFQQAQALVVVVTAQPEEVILRQPEPNRGLAEFVHTEYTTRTRLYRLAALTVDVSGLAKEDAAQTVTDGIKKLLANPR